MPVTTRSQKILAEKEVIPEEVPRNEKGHPSVGYIRPKLCASKKSINPYVNKCYSLRSTTDNLTEVLMMKEHPNFNLWMNYIFEQLFQFVHKDMEESMDEIDYTLMVCRMLRKAQLTMELNRFLSNCPERFVKAYSQMMVIKK